MPCRRQRPAVENPVSGQLGVILRVVKGHGIRAYRESERSRYSRLPLALDGHNVVAGHQHFALELVEDGQENTEAVRYVQTGQVLSLVPE
ncbi:MAG: hypothetical protein KTR25_15950 [Myxococcales bacterium]|nr:hypothetical protein [Myxococcales bacterium]